jgi:hypothetical protein
VRKKYINVLTLVYLPQNKGAQNEAISEGLGVASMLRIWKEPSKKPLMFRKELFK